MYLSPSDIQQTRLHTIDNLHVASRAWVEATEKLAELAMRAGRQALERGVSRMAALADTREFSFDSLTHRHDTDWHTESASLVSEYFGIIGNAHQAVLHMAKQQVAVLDTVLLRQMDRAALSADANGEVAIDQLKTAIRQAESGFNELADAAGRGTGMLEEQVRQVSEALVAEPVDGEAAGAEAPAPRSRKPRAG